MFSPTWIAERLQAEGRLSVAQLRAANNFMQRNDARIEEALIQTGALEEVALLRFIAERTQTQYVPTEKLARLDISSDALGLFTPQTCERLNAFPIHYDRRKHKLVVVSPDAGGPEHLKQISIATGVRDVKAYLVRPAAIPAAIHKWYDGEIQAFAGIAPETFTQLQSAADLLRTEAMGGDARAALDSVPDPAAGVGDAPPAGPAQRSEPNRHQPLAMREAKESGVVRADGAVPSTTRGSPHSSLSAGPAAPPSATAAPATTGVERRLADLAEMLNVLVALNENARDEFRGHSASVARFSRQLASKMGMPAGAVVHAGMAANLHDLGKPVAYHLTAINLSQYATHRTAALKLYLTPLRLLESIELPGAATGAVAAMYERFDGQGFPSGLRGKDIPVGARILSLCDAYSDLTLNPRNPYRRMLSQAEALKVLSEFSGTLFDPDLAELLVQIAAGENLKRQLAEHRQVVLLVEPAPEDATIMELRLVAQGFEVKIARTAAQAMEFVESDTINFVLSEVDLQPFDGFELLSRLRARESVADVPFFFVSRMSDTAAIDRAFTLGAQDYVVKPTSGDVLAAKLRRVASPRQSQGAAQGISGSLAELALPDLAQILAQGRKTGKLTLRFGSDEAEVFFDAGEIVHARHRDVEGQDAFYELLGVADGSFSLDPGAVSKMHTIKAGVESLILEGLRRLDEKNR